MRKSTTGGCAVSAMERLQEQELERTVKGWHTTVLDVRLITPKIKGKDTFVWRKENIEHHLHFSIYT
jgi:hypothetical protein